MELSIITINLNNSEGLKDTFRSIEGAGSLDFEYIVIDGKSNDSSQEVIREFKRVDKFLIESDEGVFDAMNKGVSLASRKYVYFLNSGDILLDGIKRVRLLDSIEYYQVKTIVNGDIRHIDLRPFPIHQGIVMLKSLLLENRFDHSLKIFGDLDLWYRLDLKVDDPINNAIAVMYVEGLGSAPEFIIKRIRDKARLWAKHKRIRDLASIFKMVLLLVAYKIFGINTYYKLAT